MPVRHRRDAAAEGRDRARARRAARRSSEVWGIAPGEPLPVEAAGRTDTEIAREILLLAGVDARAIDDRLEDFRAAAVRRYAELCRRTISGRVAPGAERALTVLDARADVRLSLVTGNIEAESRASSCAPAGIGGWFASGQGGFGSDSEDRCDLPPIARARAAAWNGGEPWPRERTVVVGDTPRDIACARADGTARRRGRRPGRSGPRSSARPTPSSAGSLSFRRRWHAWG